jgi:hypothetical protein
LKKSNSVHLRWKPLTKRTFVEACKTPDKSMDLPAPKPAVFGFPQFSLKTPTPATPNKLALWNTPNSMKMAK